MNITEKVGAIAFMTIIVVVYWIELRYVISYLINKFKGRNAANIFVTKSAIFVHFLNFTGIRKSQNNLNRSSWTRNLGNYRKTERWIYSYFFPGIPNNGKSWKKRSLDWGVN